MNPDQFHTLLSTLAGIPPLPGARCRGRHALFDPPGEHESPDTTDYRHAQALALCAACPALTACRGWLAQLPANRRPCGVIAGQVSRPRQIRASA